MNVTKKYLRISDCINVQQFKGEWRKSIFLTIRSADINIWTTSLEELILGSIQKITLHDVKHCIIVVISIAPREVESQISYDNILKRYSIILSEIDIGACHAFYLKFLTNNINSHLDIEFRNIPYEICFEAVLS